MNPEAIKKLLVINLVVGGFSVKAQEKDLFTIDAKPTSHQSIPQMLWNQ
ncbi:MAG TPA: hypothetical protein VFD46_08845 [Chryseolinea sp.]|nr:hypothetical protein [Chryseolinea sp.]